MRIAAATLDTFIDDIEALVATVPDPRLVAAGAPRFSGPAVSRTRPEPLSRASARGGPQQEVFGAFHGLAAGPDDADSRPHLLVRGGRSARAGVRAALSPARARRWPPLADARGRRRPLSLPGYGAGAARRKHPSGLEWRAGRGDFHPRLWRRHLRLWLQHQPALR